MITGNPAWLGPQNISKSALNFTSPHMLLLPLVPREAPAPGFRLQQHQILGCSSTMPAELLHSGVKWAVGTAGARHWHPSSQGSSCPRASCHQLQGCLQPQASPLDHLFQRDLAEGLHGFYHLWRKCVLLGK